MDSKTIKDFDIHETVNFYTYKGEISIGTILHVLKIGCMIAPDDKPGYTVYRRKENINRLSPTLSQILPVTEDDHNGHGSGGEACDER
jgi:hypothetical protein